MTIMKFHESTFEEYIRSVKQFNIHPELEPIIDMFPKDIRDFKNLIVYGPSGVGKYSQVLKILSKYSNNDLKYDKKIAIISDKNEKKKTKSESCTTISTNSTDVKTVNLPGKDPEYFLRISDIHYEVDMSLLGVNARVLWHDLFFQIIDILSLKKDKVGIIVCKNFHHTYNELIDTFYSYMRHPLSKYNIKLHFILISEHVGFIPMDIIQNCQIIPVKRPNKCDRTTILLNNGSNTQTKNNNIDSIHESDLTNLKELYHLNALQDVNNSPIDLFDKINNDILYKLTTRTSKCDVKGVRNILYELLIFNIDVTESFSHILFYCILNDFMKDKENITSIISDIYSSFKYFNNNYRSIYHLENIYYSFSNGIHYQTKIT